MNILVTGGAGYIGSHCCKRIAECGFVPVTFDNLSTGHRCLVRWGPFEHGDISDRFRLTEVVRKYKPAAVMHFAGSAYVGESVLNPAKYYQNNVAGTLTLLDTLRTHGIDHIILSSTCSVYGVPDVLPIDESTLPRPVNPYGRTKLILEDMLQDFGRAYGLHAVILRYFNAAGADPDSKTGEWHEPETHLIPLALQSAKSATPVQVFGADYPTLDGTCVRDFVHVSDLAEVHVLALQALLSRNLTGIFNVGCGNASSVQQVVEMVRAVTRRPVTTELRPRRHGDPPILIADSERLRRELNWKPSFPDLDFMVETAWSWMNKQGI